MPGPVVVHELELDDPDRPMVAGLLPRERLRLLSGDEGELAAGITWVRTPGHTEGGVCFRVETADGLVVLTGDTIGPLRDDYERVVAGEDAGPRPDPRGVLAGDRVVGRGAAHRRARAALCPRIARPTRGSSRPPDGPVLD